MRSLTKILISLIFCLLLGVAPQLYAQRRSIFTSAVIWTLVQDSFNGSCPLTNQCTITLSSNTVAGNVGLLEHVGGANISITTTTGEVLTHCSNCKQFISPLDQDWSYLASLSGGVGSIVVNLSGSDSSFGNLNFYEFHRKGVGSAAFDVSNSTTNASCQATCVTPVVTTFNSGELLVAGPILLNNPLTQDYPYTYSMSEEGAWALGWNGRAANFPQDMTGVANMAILAFK